MNITHITTQTIIYCIKLLIDCIESVPDLQTLENMLTAVTSQIESGHRMPWELALLSVFQLMLTQAVDRVKKEIARRG